MSPCRKYLKTRHQPRLCFFISDNKMTEWDRMTERDSRPQVCNVLSVVIVRCKLCCLNAVSKRKTLPRPRLGPHACCGMFIATLQSRKLKLVTTCGLGASRQDRPTCGYNPPASALYEYLSHWIWFKWSLNLSAAVILISSYWLTHNWEEILPTVGCVVSSAKYWAINAVLQSKLGYHLVFGAFTFI